MRTPSQQPEAQDAVTQNGVAPGTVAPDAVAQGNVAARSRRGNRASGSARCARDSEDAPESGVKIGAANIERFSRNLARLVEEGGRALAAYLRPREQGRITDEVATEIGDIAKTLGHVAEYWLADPQRTAELQNRLGKAYLELWAVAAKRLTGEPAPDIIAAHCRRQEIQRSGMDVEPVLRLPQAVLSADHAMGRQTGRGRRRYRCAYAAKGGVLRPPDPQCDRADQFRADQSRTAARDFCLRRGESGARHAHAGRGYRGRRRRVAHPPVRRLRCSRSDAISPSRRAKSSSRTR